MDTKTLGQLIAECECATERLPHLTLDNLLRRVLEDTAIAFVRLDTDETLGLKVSKGCVTDCNGNKIADVPHLDVLKSPEAFIEHLRRTTTLNVRSVENANF